MSSNSPVLGQKRIDSEEIERLRTSVPAEKAAIIYDNRMRALEDNHKRSFVEMGMIICEVEDQGLWKLVPNRSSDGRGLAFASIEAWASNAAPELSRTTLYSARAALRQLRGVVPANELQSMSRANVEVLSRLSTNVAKQTEVIEAAKQKTELGFRTFLHDVHPDQHIEPPKRIIFHPEMSQREVIDSVIEMAKTILEEELGEKVSRESALEAICVSYKDGHQQRYDFIVQHGGGAASK